MNKTNTFVITHLIVKPNIIYLHRSMIDTLFFIHFYLISYPQCVSNITYSHFTLI